MKMSIFAISEGKQHTFSDEYIKYYKENNARTEAHLKL